MRKAERGRDTDIGCRHKERDASATGRVKSRLQIKVGYKCPHRWLGNNHSGK